MKIEMKKILIIISIIIVVGSLIQGIYGILQVRDSYIDGANAKGLFIWIFVIIAIGTLFRSMGIVLVIWIVYGIIIWLNKK